MGDQAAAGMLASLEQAMEPEAWAELVADYTAPEILAQKAGEGPGWCRRCGAGVISPDEHLAWHYEQTITIRAAIWHALKAPMAVVELTRALADRALSDNERLLVEAIRLTVEYVGLDMLRPIEGWSWYDAWRAVDPEGLEAWLDQMPASAGGRRAPVVIAPGEGPGESQRER